MYHGDNDDGESSRAKSDWDLPTELKPFETHLKSLTPRPDRLDRERLMFLAGQASVEEAHMSPRGALRQRWAWPVSFATMTAVAATLFVMLLTRSAYQTPLLSPKSVPAQPYTSDVAQQKTTYARPQNMLSVAVIRNNLLEEFLDQEKLLLSSDSPPYSMTVDEQQDRVMLTPGSWNQVLRNGHL